MQSGWIRNHPRPVLVVDAIVLLGAAVPLWLHVGATTPPHLRTFNWLILIPFCLAGSVMTVDLAFANLPVAGSDSDAPVLLGLVTVATPQWAIALIVGEVGFSWFKRRPHSPTTWSTWPIWSGMSASP